MMNDSKDRRMRNDNKDRRMMSDNKDRRMRNDSNCCSMKVKDLSFPNNFDDAENNRHSTGENHSGISRRIDYNNEKVYHNRIEQRIRNNKANHSYISMRIGYSNDTVSQIRI